MKSQGFEPGKCLIQHAIDLSDYWPINFSGCRAPAKQDAVKDEIENMLKPRIVTRSYSSSGFHSCDNHTKKKWLSLLFREPGFEQADKGR